MHSISDNIGWLKRRFGTELVEITVQGDRPLLLDDPSAAYVTLCDHHQLFCVGYRDGKPEGRREHLAPCAAGQVVFGVSPTRGDERCALLLSGVAGSVVWCIPSARLLSLDAEEHTGSRRAELFDSWIRLLLSFFTEFPVPTSHRALQSAQVIEADPEVALMAPSGVLWIAPEATLCYRGIQVGNANAAVRHWPVAGTAWALCQGASCTVSSSDQLLAQWPNGCFATAFADFALASIGDMRAGLRASRLRRQSTSLHAERFLVRDAVRELTGASDEAVPSCGDTTPEDGYERACKAICQQLDVLTGRVVKPRSLEASDVRNALVATTGLRTRPVRLDRDFHRHDAGLLLAFEKVSGGTAVPVALLPRASGYDVIGPPDGARRTVDASMRERLEERAYQFYRTLPAGLQTLARVARFAAQGTGKDVSVVLATGLATGVLAPLLAPLTGLLYDRVIPAAELGLLSQVICVLLGLYVGWFFFDAAKGLSLLRAQTRAGATLEAAVWDRLLRLPLGFFRTYSAGDLASRMLGLSALREVLADVALTGLLASVFALSNLAVLFYVDVGLASIAAGILAATAILGVVAGYFELRHRRQLSAFDGRLQGLLLQLFTGMAKLRTLGGENRAFYVWSQLFAKRRDAEVAGAQLALRMNVVHAALPLLSNLVVFYWVTRDLAGSLSVGDFLMFNTAFGALTRAQQELTLTIGRALRALPLYERTRPILGHPVECQGEVGGHIELTGHIELSHVSLRYDAAAPLVLDDLSLRVEPGEFVAIVGPSGSGKSTLLRVLLGFEAPTAGAVYFDGQALSGLDIRAVRRQIGAVLQHSQVMNGDIFSNIVGDSGLTMDDAWRAARLAAFDKDVEAMPMGMRTMITAGGGTLSGGQRQRLLIARALAKRPNILLFDEATSALDNRTQSVVRASLDMLRVTRLVVAHRLSTIRNADRILVLDRGQVVQSGTFASLMAEGGTFGRLARRQML